MSRLHRPALSALPIAGLLLVLATLPTRAQDPRPAATPAATPSPSIDYCTCRAFGERFAPGERICLGSGESARMAECGMSLNVMNWRVPEEPCPRV